MREFSIRKYKTIIRKGSGSVLFQQLRPRPRPLLLCFGLQTLEASVLRLRRSHPFGVHSSGGALPCLWVEEQIEVKRG